VIENLMFAALGAVVVALVGLLLIPAIHNRAERLAKRRAEALFPLSIAELTAEKDHLRAEFAVMQRRIERRAEEALAYKHQSMEELGRRTVRIEALETTLAERDQHISTLQTDLADARHQLSRTEEELATTKVTLSATRETLAAVENAHRRTLEELSATRSDLDRTHNQLAATRAELTQTQERTATLEAAYADLDGRHTETLRDLDAKRITISDLDTRLTAQTARGDDFERALSDRQGELSDERRRLADLARNLLAEQERGLMLDRRIRELEGEREHQAVEIQALTARLAALSADGGSLAASPDEGTSPIQGVEQDLADARRLAAVEGGNGPGAAVEAELRSWRERYETLKAERSALEGALATAREERARLAQEMQALRRNPGAPADEIRAENAELRRRIDELADRLMQGAETRDGPGDRRSVHA
jgi:chromosome segregation ATPase